MTSILALSILAACATSPASAPTPRVIAAAPALGGSRLAGMLGSAGGPNAPTRADVETALGRADIARQDGAGAALTYRLDTCALLLLFAVDARNVLRLSETHPSPRQAGQAAPSLAQCTQEAGARRAP